MNRPSSSRSLLVPALIVIAGILLALNLGSPTTQVVEGPFSFILAPLQQAVSGLGRAISDLFRSASEVQDLRARVQTLQTQADDLTTENVRLREFQAEVKQYRDLLKFANDNPAFNVVGADVIGVGVAGCNTDASTRPVDGRCANVIASDPSPYTRYLTINVGRIHGIRTGMPVVGGGFALVGRVGQVNETSSQVQLLIDPNSFVNALVVEERTTGVVAGQSDGSLHLIDVPQTDNLKPKDLIVTSGLGGQLPRLLTIGQVDRIISTDAQLFKEAIVRPAVDFNRIEVVLVITSAGTGTSGTTP